MIIKNKGDSRKHFNYLSSQANRVRSRLLMRARSRVRRRENDGYRGGKIKKSESGNDYFLRLRNFKRFNNEGFHNRRL